MPEMSALKHFAVANLHSVDKTKIILLYSAQMLLLFLNRGLMSFQHVNPQEAVEIHQDIKSNSSVAIHWGTFNLSYEASVRNI